MRYTLEHFELDEFRIDDYKPQIRRAVFIEPTDKKRVKPYALTRSARARNKHMKRFRKVGDNGVTDDILTYRERKRGFLRFLENVAFDYLFKPYYRPLLVRDFHAYKRRARNGSDTNVVFRFQTKFKVVRIL